MATTAKKQETFTRFTLSQRIEHIVQLVSFTVLGLTGLIQKFNHARISLSLINLLGGVEMVRIIHRVFATALMLAVIWHLVDAGYKLFVLRKRPHMLPTLNDGLDLIQKVAYNLGIRREHPRMPRFNVDEKLEYWAFVWGTVVMVITGFMLWNPIATVRFLPGQWIPAAKAAHGGEAVLAVLAIILWHFYNVHVKQFNKSMFTGQMSREMMAEEHMLELEDIEAGRVFMMPPPDVLKKRQQVYYPVAAVLAIILLVGVLWFVTAEDTAIHNIPGYDVEVVPPELQK